MSLFRKHLRYDLGLHGVGELAEFIELARQDPLAFSDLMNEAFCRFGGAGQPKSR